MSGRVRNAGPLLAVGSFFFLAALAFSSQEPLPLSAAAQRARLEVMIDEFGILPNSDRVYELEAEITNHANDPLPVPSCFFEANAKQKASIEWELDEPLPPGQTSVRRGLMRFEKSIHDVGIDQFGCSDANYVGG